MNQSAEIRCQCSTKNKVYFKKPHVVQASIVQATCGECKSVWLHRVSAAKKGHVSIQSKLLHVGPMLVELLKEEAEFNDKPLEDALNEQPSQSASE